MSNTMQTAKSKSPPRNGNGRFNKSPSTKSPAKNNKHAASTPKSSPKKKVKANTAIENTATATATATATDTTDTVDNQWTCSQCTFENDSTNTNCSMCGNRKLSSRLSNSAVKTKAKKKQNVENESNASTGAKKKKKDNNTIASKTNNKKATKKSVAASKAPKKSNTIVTSSNASVVSPSKKKKKKGTTATTKAASNKSNITKDAEMTINVTQASKKAAKVSKKIAAAATNAVTKNTSTKDAVMIVDGAQVPKKGKNSSNVQKKNSSTTKESKKINDSAKAPKKAKAAKASMKDAASDKSSNKIAGVKVVATKKGKYKRKRDDEEENMEIVVKNSKTKKRKTSINEVTKKVASVINPITSKLTAPANCILAISGADEFLSDLFSTCAKLLNTKVETDMSKPFTHLIVCKNIRSLKVLFACARGIELIDVKWLYAVIGKSGWLAPSDYLSPLFTSKRNQFSIRDNMPSRDSNLLHGAGIYINERITSPPRLVMEQLVQAAGGKAVSSLRGAVLELRAMDGDFQKIGKRNTPALPLDWLFDSLIAGEQLVHNIYLGAEGEEDNIPGSPGF